MNNKGQFSIIAALLVALVLVGAVVTTYSAIRYSDVQEQPQILSVSDETNLAVEEILGFTVGYYGSVLKVTGNQTYAEELATDYLRSGLQNMDAVNPEWGLTINVTDLELDASWFSNRTYSEGNATVTYDLNGLGMTGVSYFASTRLEVQILEANSTDQAQLTILTDEGKPLINLAKSNFNFHRYDYEALAWDLTEPDSVISYANGTYLIDLPAGVLGSSYDVELKDNRGLMVIASSYSQITSTVAWNTTGFSHERDYVDSETSVLGSHSLFAAQQDGPDGLYDTLAEEAYGVVPQPTYPTARVLYGSTTDAGGTLGNLQSNNGVDTSFNSYISGFSGSESFGCQTIGGSTLSIEDYIRGSLFSIPSAGQAQSISAYIDISGAITPTVKAAIYSQAHTFIAETDQTVVSSDGWYTFNIITQPLPILQAGTSYILVAWSNSVSGDVYLRYASGSSNQAHRRSQTYGAWPASPSFSHNDLEYSICCTYSPASEYTAQVEFTGSSSTPLPWTDLVWAIDGATDVSGVTATLQLFEWGTGYPTSGDGHMVSTLGIGDTMSSETITVSPGRFVDGSGDWKIMVTAVKSTSTPFRLELDLVEFSPEIPNYALDLQEQWFSVNASNIRQDLCIKTGDLSAESLVVQVLHGGFWQNLMTLTPNYFNNVSLVPWIDSPTLTIRFVGGDDLTDITQHNWDIDCVFIKDQPDVNFLVNLQESTFTLEVLQNGTMRWIGQNMESKTDMLPIPPVCVKAIHVNQTFVNGTNVEVPFQIEDWASEYQIPLGLTSNTTVFSNRQMIVFLLDCKVISFTIWWDGSDSAVQTPLAYTNLYFNDDIDVQTLNNGRLNLVFSTNGFVLTSTVDSVTSTSTLMRINNENDDSEPELSFPISSGIVRDIMLGEAEYGGGIANCPNTYSNIIITLPAGVTYYTYQLRVMFLDATARTVSDLCPVKLTTSQTPVQVQTEDGLLAGFPIVHSGTGVFYNDASEGWTEHHWSQLVTDTGKGTGIMFTSKYNQRLYAFDAIAGEPTGALNVNAASRLIELRPVSLDSASFTYAYDVCWRGAVATFDGTTPVCRLYDATTPTGLWLLVEYPPTLTVTASC